MNPEAQAKLDSILQKNVNSLTPGDVVFLRARQSYLTKKQKETYKEVLVVKEEEAPKPKRKKKVEVEEVESEVLPKVEEKPKKKK